MARLQRISLIILISLLFTSLTFAEITREYLEYDNEKVRLGIYNPNRNYCPVVILIHGAAGIESESRAARYKGFATDLMNKGIIAINVYYFDSKRGNWVKTFIQALNYIENIPNADRYRIGIVGYSLGGTIALKVASLDSRVKVLAISAGYLPQGFTKEDAANLPKTYMISGTEDSSIHTLNKLKEWFAELNKPFQSKIDKGYGHTIPMTLFHENWNTIVKFFVENL